MVDGMGSEKFTALYMSYIWRAMLTAHSPQLFINVKYGYCRT